MVIKEFSMAEIILSCFEHDTDNEPIYEVLNEFVNNMHLEDGDYLVHNGETKYKFGVKGAELDYILLNNTYLLMDRSALK